MVTPCEGAAVAGLGDCTRAPVVVEQVPEHAVSRMPAIASETVREYRLRRPLERTRTQCMPWIAFGHAYRWAPFLVPYKARVTPHAACRLALFRTVSTVA